MAASIKDIAAFFKTGDPARDSLKAFSAEWKDLSEADKEYFKENVPTS